MIAPPGLDGCCCQGGATAGYLRAGFKMTGVDIHPQPRYEGSGGSFVQGDIVNFIYRHGHKFKLAHVSPPCQKWTKAQRIQKREHPDLIGPVRKALLTVGVPYVIENVPDAASELIDPVMLCGNMFPELNVYRHRLFETGNGFQLVAPDHGPHLEPQVKMGRPVQPGMRHQPVGNFSGVAQAKADMGGVDWMNRDGIRESIPPAYTEYIGRQLMAHLAMERAA